MYTGRFAPSPTGDVHFGTLVAAVASYLQARTRHGRWLLRIDDIDTTRHVENADTHIIKTLEHHGFEWHGSIDYPSKNTAFYQAALQELIAKGLIFPCLCSRKQLTEQAGETPHKVYPGNCRQRKLPEPAEHALRLRGKNQTVTFHDQLMGWQQQNIQDECGDYIVKRRDGLFAYQLAVVVDDARQGITEVVRGVDLLESTPRQIYLQQLLGYTQPAYLHIPLATDHQGNKLSKSTDAACINKNRTSDNLVRALDFLGQQPADNLNEANIGEIWTWAINHWSLDSVPVKKTITIN